MAQHDRGAQGSGLPHAIVAYTIWGLLPLFFYSLREVPPVALVAWRIVFTVPLCLALLAATGALGTLRRAVGNPRVLGWLAASTICIGCNWVLYMWSIQNGHVLAASLGYYINPMLNVVLGTIFLGERLRRLQWLAVALAGVAIALLALGALDTLWISLALAGSFATYGLIRKLAPVESLPGLTVETLLMIAPAIAVLVSPASGADAGMDSAQTGLMLAATGPLTAIPLMLFAIAARRMDYSSLGFVQYIGPSLTFLVGIFVFREVLREVQLICFVLIWIAVAIFCVDLLARRRKEACLKVH